MTKLYIGNEMIGSDGLLSVVINEGVLRIDARRYTAIFALRVLSVLMKSLHIKLD